MTDNAIPRDWSYNPSEWSQRLPIVALALVGFGVASYLALYQWRIFETVWEPFFGDGSCVILNSRVSRILPVPDAALGAFAYLVDAVTGAVVGVSVGGQCPGSSFCLDWRLAHLERSAFSW